MAPSGKWIEGIGPETTVADAARRSLEPRLAVVAHALPLAAHLAEHDIEHVHRLRVATRRAAAALKLYRDWLPQKTKRWIKKRLRQIRRAAGEARDLDVLIQRLQRDSDPQAEPIVRFLVEKRAAVQPDIIELAEGMRRDDRFVRKAARLFTNITPADVADDSATPERLCDWAPPQLDKFRSAFVELRPESSDDIEALHQFRIRTQSAPLRHRITCAGLWARIAQRDLPWSGDVAGTARKNHRSHCSNLAVRRMGSVQRGSHSARGRELLG